MIKNTALALAALSLLPLVSCRRYLWMDSGEESLITLRPDWSTAGRTPEGCEAYIFRDGLFYKAQLSQDPDAVNVYLPDGTYEAMVMSYSEAEYGTFTLDGKDALKDMHTVAADASPFGMQDERTYIQSPEWVASGLSGEFTVESDGTGRRLIKLRPRTLEELEVRTIGDESAILSVPVPEKSMVGLIEARIHADGATRVRAITLHVNGIFRGRYFSTGENAGGLITFDLQGWHRDMTGKTTGCFSGTSPAFGWKEDMSPDDMSVEFIMAEFLLAGGGTFTFSDASRITVRQEDDLRPEYCGHLIIEVADEGNPVVLPESGGSDTAETDAWVNPWGQEQNTTIPL